MKNAQISKDCQLLIIALLTIGLGIAMFKRTADYDYLWLIPSCIWGGCVIGWLINKSVRFLPKNNS